MIYPLSNTVFTDSKHDLSIGLDDKSNTNSLFKTVYMIFLVDDISNTVFLDSIHDLSIRLDDILSTGSLYRQYWGYVYCIVDFKII